MNKTYSIVGQKFLKVDPTHPGVEAGAPVVLVREPDNKFDPNAVQVWIDGKRVGYLPSKQNVAIAQFIDQAGRDFDTDVMAQDGATPVRRKAIDAKFIRSPNSGYPMVQVGE